MTFDTHRQSFAIISPNKYTQNAIRPCSSAAESRLYESAQDPQRVKFMQTIFKGVLLSLRPFLATESPLKIIKKLFISPQTDFSFSRYLSFCLDFLVMQQNGLIRKIGLMSNFMKSKLGYPTIVVHILPNISRSKDNQTMKFGQLIEYNMTKNFLEKSYIECCRGTSSRQFSEKLRLTSLLLLYICQVEDQ